ncbi:RING-type E3 ubiquitin-protein ligase ppil2 [Cichlidogyrus casuarinus]|uniref:Peptidyl-prolyl cis-trans isomerase n=1 Tax=Cichlidogyrus casuarinus TaxID=1844966 RepID=A0ABD2Q4H4_9PLAT
MKFLCSCYVVVFKPYYVFRNILPFLKKHKVNPVTGEKMKSGDLIKLHFHKNSNDKYHCPVTFKVFNENTHIVAIRPSGNVYAFEAVERLNLKSQNMVDLLNNVAFTKEDIIEIQDPSNLEKFDINAFYHVKNAESKKTDAGESLIRSANPETRETLNALKESQVEIPDYMLSNKTQPTAQSSKERDSFNTANYSTHAAAHSLTSTVMQPATRVEAAVLSDDIVRYRYVKKKGYVRLITSHGNLNLELHCDLVPKTCENFIRLCESGYYNDTEFHRLIKHFIVSSSINNS